MTIDTAATIRAIARRLSNLAGSTYSDRATAFPVDHESLPYPPTLDPG